MAQRRLVLTIFVGVGLVRGALWARVRMRSLNLMRTSPTPAISKRLRI